MTDASPAVRQPLTPPAPLEAPRLLEGTQLIGRVDGSGLREAPYLIRRADGQAVQLSRLLFVLAQQMDGRRDLTQIAARAGEELDVRITADQVRYVAEQKLHPLGLVPAADGSPPALKPVDALLALRFRVGVVPAGVVGAIARILQPLFLPPIVMAVLAGVVGFDIWLAVAHGLRGGISQVIAQPILALALFASTIVSLAFHECGHAAACRYGGARPGRIGIGIYLVWPVFFTDVTDSYRLGRAGRLRTDLGGVYFNLLFALTAAWLYAATGYEPLVLVVVMQQVLLLDQFVPWVRLDGYHIVSDLIGVSDLFARIKPVLTSLLPGREPDRRVAELRPWARAAVTTWVVTTVVALAGGGLYILLTAPSYLRQGWVSLQLQLDGLTRGVDTGNVTQILTNGIGTLILSMPVLGLALTYLFVCHGLGAAIALARVRAEVAATREQVPRQPSTAMPAVAPRAGQHG